MVLGNSKLAVVRAKGIKDKFGDLNVNDFLRSTIAQDGGKIEEQFPTVIGMVKPNNDEVKWRN